MAQQPTDWQKQITENLIHQQRSTTPHSNDTGAFTPPPRPSTETTVPDDEKRYSPLISPLPPNAVVFKHSDPNNDSSFNRFIETEYGPVLHNRLSEGSLKQQQQQPSNSGVVHNKHSDSTLRDSKHYDYDGDENLATFWTALAKDLDTKKKQHIQQAPVKHNSNWYQGYDYNATESNGLPAPWWVNKHDEDGVYSVGALLFIFGFICPPLWWIGAVWPRRPRERGGKMAERWQKLNRIMSIGFSVVLILAIIICVAVWKGS